MTLGQETRWAYSTTLTSPHGSPFCRQVIKNFTYVSCFVAKLATLQHIKHKQLASDRRRHRWTNSTARVHDKWFIALRHQYSQSIAVDHASSQASEENLWSSSNVYHHLSLRPPLPDEHDVDIATAFSFEKTRMTGRLTDTEQFLRYA